jgi:hypothetical protein
LSWSSTKEDKVKKLAFAVLLAGSLLAVLATTGAGAAPTGTLTLTGKPSPRDQKTIDIAPKGESVGDRVIISETLRSEGGPTARMESDCLLVDRTYQGALCSATLIFRDGKLLLGGASLSKRVPRIGGGGNDFAIVGGTGAYTAASGTAQVKSTSKGDRITLRFST